MTATFGVPPEGERIRSMVEERLRQAITENGAKVTVDWRGQPRHLDVIAMPVELLYLNPDTHRIRAQRTLDPERNQILDEAPWSEPAQLYLRHLLTCDPAKPEQVDPDYAALKEELQEFGQKDPGIISPTGILVDGNTRCAALRDLGAGFIRVAVLPPDTSRDDINNVELSLQLRRDKRREYSYINRLIAIEEQLGRGRREDDVAKDFNIKLKTLQQDRWVYQLITDAIERSRTDSGAELRLVHFEDHQEKLRELQRDFENLRKKNVDAAEQLKESRLAMVVLGYSKTDVRAVEPDFYDRYIGDRLPDDVRPATTAVVAQAIPGLPGVTAVDGNEDVQVVRGLTDKLLKAKATAEAADKVPAAEVAEADRVFKTVRATTDNAVKLAVQSGRLKKRQTAVPERLTDAADFVDQCASEFAAAKAKRALDEDAFDDALVVLKASLERLARQAARVQNPSSQGVAWLLAATREQ
ncbi:hypothetical protein [Dactylosporangium sp. CS-033363]|uniref:hypothetical protein n=1 Tax=Dactylosporangium sp. CS-033363 TaxID=3239935 RepID=UPI003D8C0BFF